MSKRGRMQVSQSVQEILYPAEETTLYLRCVKNETLFDEDKSPTFEADLVIGQIYKALPTSEAERSHGMVRVMDGSGEAYLYPADYFEPVAMNGTQTADS